MVSNYVDELFISNLETLVNTDSGHDCIEGMQRVSSFMAEKYEEMGLDVKKLDFGVPCIEARNHPNEKKIDILVIGHMDTVFCKGTAQKRPFRYENGRAFGPGVADMKSGLLMGAKFVECLLRETPSLNICIANNSDEEIGSPYSHEWLYSLAKESKYCFDFEPGRADGSFVSERKGVLRLKIKMHGIASHAGIAPEEGASAIIETAKWICHFAGENAMKEGVRVGFNLIKGGKSYNVIPEYAESEVDVRYDDPDDLKYIEECFERLKEKPFDSRIKVEISELGSIPPMNTNEKSKVLIGIISEEAERTGYQTSFAKVGGGSDASVVSLAGIATIDACGPIGDGFHSSSEYCDIDSINDRMQLLLDVCRRLFG